MNHPVLFSVAFVLTLAMVLTGLALMRHARREERLRMRLRMANGTYVAHAANGPATPQAGQMLAFSVIGSQDTVRRRLSQLIEDTGADELMIVSDMYDPAKRLRSFELIAEAMA